MRIHHLLQALSLASFAPSALSKLTWQNTKFLFTFGDSYTTEGFNISAGVDSPTPGYTSSNGPNWVTFLRGTYNVTDTKVFNLASGGATIDSTLVPPYLPTVLSIVDQVGQFKTHLSHKPSGAHWQSNNTLFAIWIGINDVGNSVGWANTTFYSTLMAKLTTQLDELYDLGARSFLLLSVPPVDRSPLVIQQGASSVATFRTSLEDFNNQLSQTVHRFQARHKNLDLATVFDTRPIFNVLLDNAQTFGFVNSTGWCDAYQNGTPGRTTQVSPCAPVSNYFWLNSLHPLFTVHESIAHAISTTLSV
ncbi:hypothetical protein BDN72DRAFT_684189 [Pluteus cervinus]|uniref:Uncharacterized protein n=1 Tax=Pluteus cervinus TaxID=181527 RepID=A0ACD3AR29_9AGAR|nr:hypothetical protein BDN72DRAFT_684189 [Pluteus cervinus]